MNENQFEEFEGRIVEIMREFKIPGLSIGVVKDGKSIYIKGFGARNLEKNLPFTPDTLFGIGSISKSFTTLAVMQLYEQEKINIQDPVGMYLNFKLGKKDNPIKIYHMFSHSTGIPELDGNEVALLRHLGILEPIIPMSSWDDFLLHMNSANTEIFGSPEKYFFYNNDMFTCLGLIVEKITNMKFEDYMKENILKPLEMNRSTYLKQDFEKDDDVLTGYLPSNEKKLVKDAMHPFDKIVYAPGGLLSSVSEMQNYIIALINGGKFNQSQIIQKSSLEKMWTPYIKIPEETSYSMGDSWYGYGWIIEKNFLGHKLLQHGGNVGTSTAFLAIIPNQKIGVIIGANSDASIVLGSIARIFLAILLDKDFDEAAPLIKIHNKLKSLTGKYKIYKELQTMDISLDNGVLFAKIKNPIEPKPRNLPLAPENLEELKFYVPIAYPNRKIKVQFFIDEETDEIHLTFDRYYFHKI